MDASVAQLVTELGCPWYVAMLADEGVYTAGDVLRKVGLLPKGDTFGGTRSGTPDVELYDSENAASDRLRNVPSHTSIASMADDPILKEDRVVFISAYLLGLGFSETHAGEISETIVAKTNDMFVEKEKQHALENKPFGSAGRLFLFDSLDKQDGDEDAGDVTLLPSGDDQPGAQREHENFPGPSEAERRTVRAAVAASKARAALRTSRASHDSGESGPLSGTGSSAVPSTEGSRRGSVDLPEKRREQLGIDRVTATTQERVRTGSIGGLYSSVFLNAVKPLYDLHMGAENLGPLLYSFARFVKPARVLEVGAGYTSAFLLQALCDNAHELEAYRKLRGDGLAMCGDAPWSVNAFFETSGGAMGGRYRGEDRERGNGGGGARVDDTVGKGVTKGDTNVNGSLDFDAYKRSDLFGPSAGKRNFVPKPFTEDARVTSGVLHCIDNMAHQHTTAHVVKETAEKMNCGDRLKLHDRDAFDPDLPSTLEPGTEFDLLWIDLGAAHRCVCVSPNPSMTVFPYKTDTFLSQSHRIEQFMENWWPRVRPEGGHVIVHSTLTNALSRGWLEKMRELSRSDEQTQFGKFEIISFLEVRAFPNPNSASTFAHTRPDEGTAIPLTVYVIHATTD
jgi:hypothetical protein